MNDFDRASDLSSTNDFICGRDSQALYNQPAPQKDLFLIESVDTHGRQSFRSVRDSWKRKSDLANPERVYSSEKGRISINAKGHEIFHGMQEDQPFQQDEGLQREEQQIGRPSKKMYNKKFLGTTSEQRLSRISQMIKQHSHTQKGQIYTLQEVDEECDLFEYAPPEEVRKLSIKSINVTQRMKHMQSSTFSSILSRASQLLIQSTFQDFEGVDIDEEETGDTDPLNKHRCSMVKRYNMPTFFSAVPDKRMQTPAKPATHALTVMSNQQSASESRAKRDLKNITDDMPQKQELSSGSQGPDELTVLNLMQQTSSNSGQVSQVVEGDKEVQPTGSDVNPYSFVEYNLERMSNIVVNRQSDEQDANIVEKPHEERSSLMVTGESLLETKQPEENKLDAFTTKVAQNTSDAGNMTAVDLHKQHFHQTMQALEKITRDFSPAPSIEVLAQQVGLVYLPPPERPEEQRKVAIFDMDETLIHCVDDIEKENPEVLLEIDFSPNQDGSNPEDIVCAGINIRPYIIECLEEAAKNFQVIVFTASHQTYADAILDYIDPDHRLISYRMYRQHCYLTPENYYIKDLRVIANRDLKDMVLVDNSVFSFAYQLENGVPIVSFYRQPPQDEEMLHLIYYLSVLGGVNDVRTQNIQAFELHKLAGLQPPQFEEEAGQVEGDEEQDFQEIPEVTNESDYDSIRK